MKNLFNDILKGKLVIMGIGNSLRGDDGFGPALIEKLQGISDAVCIDAGTAPESYAGKVAKQNPDTILIADAVHLGKAAGEYAILTGEDIVRTGFATHDISPAMFMDYLKQETGADIYMLGVQPQDVSFGSEMSEAVVKALIQISELIKEIIR